MYAWDLLYEYLDSGDCPELDRPHIACLAAATRAGIRMGQNWRTTEIDLLKRRNWMQFRSILTNGGWFIPGGDVQRGWSRPYINLQFRRLQRAMRWGAANGMIEQQAYEIVDAIQPLVAGKTRARDHVQPGPVQWRHVRAIRDYVRPWIFDMVHIQHLTGMRCREVVRMKCEDIQKLRGVWFYRPGEHNPNWRGKRRTFLLGPQVIWMLKTYWPVSNSGYLFRRRNGKRFTRDHYVSAVCQGIAKAKCPIWHPFQLHLARAMAVSGEMSREDAAKRIEDLRGTTGEYARRSVHLAVGVARKMGEMGEIGEI